MNKLRSFFNKLKSTFSKGEVVKSLKGKEAANSAIRLSKKLTHDGVPRPKNQKNNSSKRELSALEFNLLTQMPIVIDEIGKAQRAAAEVIFNNNSVESSVSVSVTGGNHPLPLGILKVRDLYMNQLLTP